jgi:hypothetical protein
MTTTTTTPAGYTRLDMTQLPPYKLERMRLNGSSYYGPYTYKNIYNADTAASDAASELAALGANTRTRHTQTKSTKMRRPFCKYCKHRGFPLKECKTHYTKSGPEFGAKITCPHLLKQQCARCGEIGHTPKHCQSPHWLKTDPCQIRPDYNPGMLFQFQGFLLDMLEEREMKRWQRPIPPALQAEHDAYVDRYVKTSRVWIEMTGDHTKYTDDYMLCQGGPQFVPFSMVTRTEYEIYVENHYKWMRTVQFEPEKPNEEEAWLTPDIPPAYVRRDDANVLRDIINQYREPKKPNSI